MRFRLKVSSAALGLETHLSNPGDHEMGQVFVVDGSQLQRLMRMCRVLCTGGGLTVRQLQGKLKTSRRTIFRNLNSLEEMGIKVELGEKGYRIPQSPATCKRALAQSQEKMLKKLLNTCLK
jgi:biotin operon repressor